MRKLVLIILFGALIIKLITLSNQPINSSGPSKNVTKQNSSNKHLNEVRKNIFEDSSININDLVLTGFDNNHLLYKLQSSKAFQVSESCFELNLVKILYDIDKNQQLKISAVKGIIDQKNGFISLEDKIHITTDKYILDAGKLEIGFDKSYLDAKGNVKFRYDKSQISSNECKLFNNSQYLKCHGAVEANINLDDF